MITFQAGHPDYPIPPFTKPIWRYMEDMQFVFLLAKRALHFARASTLPDLFEGALTPSSRTPDERLAEVQTTLRKSTFLNCWYEGEEESAAMWERQLGGVAIKTNLTGLAQGILARPGTHIYIGRVKYIDYEKQAAPLGNEFSHFLYKRTNYSHEQEIRAMARAMKRPGQKRDDLPLDLAPPEAGGIYVEVDLGVLIKRVVASPSTPDYVFDALEAVMSVYGLDCPISRSTLTQHPPLGLR